MRMQATTLQAAIVTSFLASSLLACGRSTSVTSLLDQPPMAVSSPSPTPAAAVDTVPPTIASFTVPATSSSPAISGIGLQATDNVGITGYLLTDSSTAPLANGSGWSSTAPAAYTFTGIPQGVPTARTLYAWAKDAAGNVSASRTATVTITIAPSNPISTGGRLKRGVSMYGSFPSQINQAQLNWALQTFDQFNAGMTLDGTMNPYLASASDIAGKIWGYYFDIYFVSLIPMYLDYKDWANARGLSIYESLLHAKRNYIAGSLGGTTKNIWAESDKFDKFEGANGVLRTSDDINYTDLTATAYSGSVTWQNTMYIGYEEPFAEINLTISTAGTGITRTWEYWNGSAWSALAVSDGTSAFSTTGKISFLPPSNWKRKSVHSSRSKYFVRCRITTATVSPVTSSVKGENWLVSPSPWVANTSFAQYSYISPSVGTGLVYIATTGGISGANAPTWPTSAGGTVTDGTIVWKAASPGRAGRGWDPTSPNIINAGSELAFNPTPPSGASARFRHQAYITGWNEFNFVINPADVQTYEGQPVRIWAKYVAEKVSAMLATGHFTGFMADDSSTDPTGSIPVADTDFADKSPNTWLIENSKKYHEIATNLHSTFPDAKIGCNTNLVDMIAAGDWNNFEQMNILPQTGGSRNTIKLATDPLNTPRTLTYDDYLPGGLLDGKIGMQMYLDNVVVRWGTTADPAPAPRWDQANRGPILALSKHLIGWNSGTWLRYWAGGSGVYNEVDVVRYIDMSRSTPLTAPLSRKTTYGPVVTAKGVDFSTFPSSMNCMVIGEGARMDVITNQTVTKTDATTLSINGVINFDHAVGDVVRPCLTAHLSTDPVPPLNTIVRWSTYFPAMDLDFGEPDPNGYNSGKRDLQWVKGSTLGGADGVDDVWRRDWTNAVILHRPGAYAVTAAQYDTPKTITLGGVYYPLQADGTTLPGTSTITLRAGEGAILMKAPTRPATSTPAVP